MEMDEKGDTFTYYTNHKLLAQRTKYIKEVKNLKKQYDNSVILFT